VPAGSVPSQAYEWLVSQGRVRRDDKQVAALRLLDGLAAQLTTRHGSHGSGAPVPHSRRVVEEAAPSSGVGFLRTLFGGSDTPGVFARATAAVAPAAARTSLPGVYLWGGPGCGKTFTMDLFYRCLGTSLKRRVHFHAFMLDVHARLHRIRGEGHRGDPIARVAQDLTAHTAIMCFDEMQVG